MVQVDKTDNLHISNLKRSCYTLLSHYTLGNPNFGTLHCVSNNTALNSCNITAIRYSHITL